MVRDKYIFFVKLVGYLIWKISCLIPRDKKKWLLGDIMGFTGNTKCWLLELQKKNKDKSVRLIWITHDRHLLKIIKKTNVECYYWLHPSAIWHCITAGVYITTDCTKDINCYLSGRAFYVTLWHGVGLKAGHRLSKKYLSVPPHKRDNFYYHVMFFYWIYRTPDLCLTTSEFQLTNFFMPMFGLPRKNFILGPYPRNKRLTMSRETLKLQYKKDSLFEILDYIDMLESYNKVYIYMPTWRDDDVDILKSTKIDFCALDKILNKNNELLILKIHIGSYSKFCDDKIFSNIRMIERTFDVYSILPFTDTLITDYSSIYSDYLLMNKEIIIFDFDKEQYLSKDRGLLFDFDEFTLGKRAHNAEQLLDLIEEHVDCHLSKSEMQKMIDIYWGAKDQKLDIFDEICNRLFKN